MLTMEHIDLSNQRVLIRQDLNVPMKEGVITNDARLKAALPTLRRALEQGASVIVMSHLGRPKAGAFDAHFSLQPIADYLADALEQKVTLARTFEDVENKPKSLTLLENVRFHLGETSNDAKLSAAYAALCDVFVMDAFGTAHREHASTFGVMDYAKTSCAGPLLQAEVEALTQALQSPKRPLVAVVGGSKVSTKLQVLHALAESVDTLIVGGGIANTFLAAQGHDVGASLYEADLIDAAQAIQQKTQVPLPVDVRTATSFTDDAIAKEVAVDAIAQQDLVLDLGSQTVAHYAKLLKEAGTILWNGPVGVFEFKAFARGTQTLAQAIAESQAYSLAGGGDTLAAIEAFDVAGQINYISTGGGAFLAFIEGQTLPALKALQRHAQVSF